MPEPESPAWVSIPKIEPSKLHKSDNPLFAFLSMHERYIVFPLSDANFLLLFQTSQIQSHILMQSLKVGSKERCAVIDDI